MAPAERDLYRKTHEAIEHITRDLEGDFHFNTAIAQIMELSNVLCGFDVSPASPESPRAVFRHAVETIVVLLSPFAPHVAEELWVELGHEPSVVQAGWPRVDPEALVRDEIEMVLQINGKVRDRMTVPADLDVKAVEALAMESDAIRRHTEGKTIRKVIVVPGRLINIAVS